eukprot:jgi/Botrbrau1/1457/Bobra.178_3s0015.1
MDKNHLSLEKARIFNSPTKTLRLVLIALAWTSVACEQANAGPGAPSPAMADSNTHQNVSDTGQKISDISPSDSNSWVFLSLLQFFPAKLTDQFPILPWLSLSPSSTTYRMKVCERESVADCVLSGKGGLPDRLQGIWWTHGLGEQTLAIGTRGDVFDSKSRRGVVSTFANQQWGYVASSSTWEGSYWTASGAALFNAFLWFGFEDHVLFNEDITFAQIVPSFRVLGYTIYLPTYLMDMSMEWKGEATWKRESKMYAFVQSEAGTYNIRQIVSGDGSKGYWFDKGWLSYKGGGPVAVPVQTYPPL